MTLSPLAMVSLDWDLVDLVEENCDYELVGVFDRPDLPNLAGLRYLGLDSDYQMLRDKFKEDARELKILLAIDPPHLRAKLFDLYGGEDSVIQAISKDAYVSKRASIGAGSIVQRGVKVMPHARLGKACKLHINAVVHHEAQIGDFCTIAPGAQILGNVRIGSGSYIGAGAIIRQRISIGERVKIGAGAVLVKDVPDGATLVGVPAERRLG